LREIREKNGLTQKQMARFCGVSLSYYTKLENGTKTPGVGFLKAFNRVFPLEDIRFLLMDYENYDNQDD
jgi:transcriptional regulator with XRE-family HTH domain